MRKLKNLDLSVFGHVVGELQVVELCTFRLTSTTLEICNSG